MKSSLVQKKSPATKNATPEAPQSQTRIRVTTDRDVASAISREIRTARAAAVALFDVGNRAADELFDGRQETEALVSSLATILAALRDAEALASLVKGS